MSGKLLNTAEDPESDLEVVNKDLYMGVSTRPTKHELQFTDEATEEYKEFIKEAAELDTEYEVEFDGDTIILLSK